jgi:hypothetical protein
MTMKNRSWPLVGLALFQSLMPVINVALSAHVMNMGIPDFLAAIFAQAGWLALADFFLLPVAAGIAIYICRPWSFGVFLAITGWNLIANLSSWWEYSHMISLPALLGATAVNFGLVTYFMLPGLMAKRRAPHSMDTEPRYYITLQASVSYNGLSQACSINNLSEGGAHINSNFKFDQDENVRIEFKVSDVTVSTEARVVHRSWRGIWGYGLQFYPDSDTKASLKQMVERLQKLGAKYRPPKSVSREAA